MTATQSLILVLLLPLLSAVLIAFFCRQRHGLAATLSVGASAGILIFSLLAISQTGTDILKATYTWLELGAFEVHMGFYFDSVSKTMLLMVAAVGFLIHVFSLGYMAKDPARGRYYGGLSIFMFSMLGIILANSLIMIFVFWELVGFSSYMLIGHYMHKEKAAAAAKKAFIVNRIGDLGFVVGIAYAYWHFGTTDLDVMAQIVGADSSLIKMSIAALLMCGFIGKSAQFPLHVWLPDAMAGPTPVSALIHAATMVAAGGYFLIRIVYLFPSELLTFIAWLGVFGAIYAGFCAYARTDIKQILAYSTLSQLGYIGAAFGLGYPGIALFHLVTHAFFKALLFLGAGSVIHGCHHEQNIFKMGGLLKKMPITGTMFFIGILALCGVYVLSGYYSKDAILIGGGFVNMPIAVLLTFGALLTAGYMGRLFWIVFLGQPNSEAAAHAKESPLSMTVPLIVLAVLSVCGGWLSYWPEALGGSIKADKTLLQAMDGYDAMYNNVLIYGTAAWVLGLLGSFFFYGRGAKEDRLQKNAAPVYGLLRSRLWFDEVYDYYVAKVQQRLAIFLSFIDVFVIKGVLVRGSAGLVGLFGMGARSLHDGNIHVYVYWFLGGMLALWVVASGLL
ncbi:MAG: NADH-quinone oxidoreductase subunit L [Puniceicoccaceae bacterium]|nr:MAG: NADH-quinone oxidoreductase subunit L [Puniceicoccaceae bacterium]